jgi:hypothetical protein
MATARESRWLSDDVVAQRMSDPRTKITREQVEQLHDLMAQNDLESALKVLRQMAQHRGDRELRDFVTLTRGAFHDIDRRALDNDVTGPERDKEHTRLRKAVLAEIRKREGEVVVPPAELAPDPSTSADGAEPAASTRARRPPLLRCQGLCHGWNVSRSGRPIWRSCACIRCWPGWC